MGCVGCQEEATLGIAASCDASAGSSRLGMAETDAGAAWMAEQSDMLEAQSRHRQAHLERYRVECQVAVARHTDLTLLAEMRSMGVARSPIFDVPGFKLEYIAIDVLHALDLGFSQLVVGNVMYEFMMEYADGASQTVRVGCCGLCSGRTTRTSRRRIASIT